MFQDMFDPEYFMSEYEIRDLSTGTVRLASGRYRDFADAGPREELLSDDAVSDERQSFYCVSVPGEAAWVQDALKKLSPACGGSNSNNIPSTSNPVRSAKRGIEDTEQNNASVSDKQTQKEGTSEEQEDIEQMDASDGVEGTNAMDATCDPTTNKRAKKFETLSDVDNKEIGTSGAGSSTKSASTQCLNLPIPNSKGNLYQFEII